MQVRQDKKEGRVRILKYTPLIIHKLCILPSEGRAHDSNTTTFIPTSV